MNFKIKQYRIILFVIIMLQMLSACVPIPVYQGGYAYNPGYSRYNPLPYGYYTPHYNPGYFGYGLRGFYGNPGFGHRFHGHRFHGHGHGYRPGGRFGGHRWFR